MKIFATCVAVLALLSLSCPAPADPVPKDAPKVLTGGARRESDPAFTKEERQLIQTARQELERRLKSPVDAYFKIRSIEAGHRIEVTVVSGYSGNQPLFTPSCTSSVDIDQEGKVLHFYGGT